MSITESDIFSAHLSIKWVSSSHRNSPLTVIKLHRAHMLLAYITRDELCAAASTLTNSLEIEDTTDAVGIA